MTFLMINQHVWASLSDSERELVRSAEDVRLGEMPLWIDARDNSRWPVANDDRTTFARNMELLDRPNRTPVSDPVAVALDSPPDWGREATDSERAELNQQRPRALDSGVVLLQPVTTSEFRSIEAILTELWTAINSNQLDPMHVRQVEAMATVLREASLEFEPEETERWQVVGAVGGILRPIFKLAQGVAALDTVVEIVTESGWTHLASDLADLIS